MSRLSAAMLVTALGPCPGCSSLLAPHFEVRATLDPLSLASVERAYAVPARTFLLPGDPGTNEVLELPAAVFEDCAAGVDVLGRLPLDFAVVQVGPDAIGFSGQQLVRLEGGLLPEGTLRDYRIMPLHDVLSERRESAEALAAAGCAPWRKAGQSQEFTGDLLLAVDQRVPAATLAEVLYTAGQAGFGDMFFMVDGPQIGSWDDGGRPVIYARGVEEHSEPALNLTVGLDAEGLVVHGYDHRLADGLRIPCHGGRCTGDRAYDLVALTSLLGQVKADWPDESELILAAGGGVSFAAMARVMVAGAGGRDRVLFPWVILAMPDRDDHTPVPAEGAVAQGQTLLPEQTLAVVVSALPEIRGLEQVHPAIPRQGDPDWESPLGGSLLEALGSVGLGGAQDGIGGPLE
jgi:hypothetical protein